MSDKTLTADQKAELRQLDAADRLDAALALLRRLEFCKPGTRFGGVCPLCGRAPDYGHAAGCELAALLREATP